MNSRKLWGILLIVVGSILGLNALNVTNINIFFEGWWSLFIIIPSLIGLFDKDDSKLDNIIWLCIGIALFLSARDIISFEMILKLTIPFVLVVLGISCLFGDNLKRTVKDKFKNINKNELEWIVATFSEQKTNRDNIKFKGCNMDAIFGSIKLDLRNADINKEAIIKASSIFGDIELLLPEDINVALKSTPIFGSISNKLRNNKDNKKTIYIDAFTLFGGINIR